MELGLPVILAVLATLFLFIYHKLTKNFNFWNNYNIIGPKPIPFFGNFKDVAFGKLHLADYVKKVYDEYYNEPVIGIFARSSPVLILRDPDVIKDVLIRKFNDFADRGVKTHVSLDPLSQHLLFLEFEKWKPMRSKLTPVFTSGKLKEMFYSILECSDNFVKYTSELAGQNAPVECRDLTARYTTDVIGMCAFGLNMNALSAEDSEFRKVGRKMFAPSWYNAARHFIRGLPLWLALFLRPIAKDQQMVDFFINTLKATITYRKNNNIKRNDFIDTLIDIKENPEKVGLEEINDTYLTSQAYVFFAAGFETSSTTMSNALYEMALNPHVQDKLRAEIEETIKNNPENLTYEVVQEMQYLDKVFNESLRKYPPGYITSRKALADYQVPNSKIVIPKGVKLFIPIYAIHHDPNIYPEPEKFDPERFDQELVKSRHPMNHLPFGDGPKNCIGKRFAVFQSKVGLIKMIQNFRFEVCEKTPMTYVKDPGPAVLAPKGGLYLKIKRI